MEYFPSLEFSLVKFWKPLFYYHWSPILSFTVCSRLNGPGQTFSNVEMGSSPTHDPQAAYIPSISKPFHLMPHVLQNSPSRFGHQSVQRFTHGRPPQGSDWNQIKIQAPSGFSNVGPRSPRNASFTGSMTWGTYYLPSIHPLCFPFINLLFCFDFITFF